MGLAGMVFPGFNDPHLHTPTLPEYIVSSGHNENWLIYKKALGYGLKPCNLWKASQWVVNARHAGAWTVGNIVLDSAVKIVYILPRSKGIRGSW